MVDGKLLLDYKIWLDYKVQEDNHWGILNIKAECKCLLDVADAQIDYLVNGTDMTSRNLNM